MPLYTYKCFSCGVEEEFLVSLANRDDAMLCTTCGKPMQRSMDAPVIGKPSFQMNAILESGRKVPGHFGKEAKKK